MKYKAIIFDLDGVICSTDEFHYLAWKAVADSIGTEFNRDINHRLRGISRRESLEIILENYPDSLSETEKTILTEQKNEIYHTLLRDMQPSFVSAEVRETLSIIRDSGVPMAIGSSSKNTPLILRQIGYEDYFDAIADGNTCARSKPAPDIFLWAASLLDVAPQDCLVVEDAVAGVEAAAAAGMDVACLGDAANRQVGDYNLTSFQDLLKIIA